MNIFDLSIAIIARDKYSSVIESITSIFLYKPTDKKVEVIVFDAGYPKNILEEIESLTIPDNIHLRIEPTEQYANTNHVWNQFVINSSSKYLMCLENDVKVTENCIDNSLELLNEKFCDIAVPIVWEVNGSLHFNPAISHIEILKDGTIHTELDRGRIDNPEFNKNRLVKHLERHSFLMSYDIAINLGKFDEQMYCRTDLDMSLNCWNKNISIGIVNNASVIFNSEPDLNVDRDFFDFRWTISRVRFAHDRLLEKWKLSTYKKTIDHVYEMRKKIEYPKFN